MARGGRRAKPSPATVRKIDRATFRDLCAGLDPRGDSPFVRGAGAQHRAGWDLTFSAPKSFSILWAAGAPSSGSSLKKSSEGQYTRH